MGEDQEPQGAYEVELEDADEEENYGPELQVTEQMADQWRHNHTEQETQRVGEILATYRAHVNKLKAKRKAKPDMVANSELAPKLRPPMRHGHMPGVRVGDKFGNRGELAILGVHSKILRGIDYAGVETGAWAISLNGGYIDDEDEGTTFWYTGQGGQTDRRQTSDQSFKNKDNKGLLLNYQTRTPVRVVRGKNDVPDQGEGSSGSGGGRGKPLRELEYTYEGLYMVTQVKRERSKDGPFVCKFKMVGLPGESVATHQVKWGSVRRVSEAIKPRRQLALNDEALAARKRTIGPNKKAKQEPVTAAAAGKTSATRRQLLLQDIRKRTHKGLLVEDITGGLEDVPIPVFNEVDNEPAPSFKYTRHYTWAPGVKEAMKPMLDALDKQMFEHMGKQHCGIKYHERIMREDKQKLTPEQHAVWGHIESLHYNAEGCLLNTTTMGVYECGPLCQSKRCKQNRLVQRGIQLPLEVFKTETMGYGLRCRSKIKTGQYIASYVGTIRTEACVEYAREENAYVFDLAHYCGLQQSKQKGEASGSAPAAQGPAAPAGTSAGASSAAEQQSAAQEGVTQEGVSQTDDFPHWFPPLPPKTLKEALAKYPPPPLDQIRKEKEAHAHGARSAAEASGQAAAGTAPVNGAASAAEGSGQAAAAPNGQAVGEASRQAAGAPVAADGQGVAQTSEQAAGAAPMSGQGAAGLQAGAGGQDSASAGADASAVAAKADGAPTGVHSTEGDTEMTDADAAGNQQANGHASAMVTDVVAVVAAQAETTKASGTLEVQVVAAEVEVAVVEPAGADVTKSSGQLRDVVMQAVEAAAAVASEPTKASAQPQEVAMQDDEKASAPTSSGAQAEGTTQSKEDASAPTTPPTPPGGDTPGPGGRAPLQQRATSESVPDPASSSGADQGKSSSPGAGAVKQGEEGPDGASVEVTGGAKAQGAGTAAGAVHQNGGSAGGSAHQNGGSNAGSMAREGSLPAGGEGEEEVAEESEQREEEEGRGGEDDDQQDWEKNMRRMKECEADGILVVDALKSGNVARFINHSPKEHNLLKQTVFTWRSRNVVLYEIAFFAERDIPAGQELLYDYGPNYPIALLQPTAPIKGSEEAAAA